MRWRETTARLPPCGMAPPPPHPRIHPPGVNSPAHARCLRPQGTGQLVCVCHAMRCLLPPPATVPCPTPIPLPRACMPARRVPKPHTQAAPPHHRHPSSSPRAQPHTSTASTQLTLGYLVRVCHRLCSSHPCHHRQEQRHAGQRRHSGSPPAAPSPWAAHPGLPSAATGGRPGLLDDGWPSGPIKPKIQGSLRRASGRGGLVVLVPVGVVLPAWRGIGRRSSVHSAGGAGCPHDGLEPHLCHGAKGAGPETWTTLDALLAFCGRCLSATHCRPDHQLDTLIEVCQHHQRLQEARWAAMQSQCALCTARINPVAFPCTRVEPGPAPYAADPVPSSFGAVVRCAAVQSTRGSFAANHVELRASKAHPACKA